MLSWPLVSVVITTYNRAEFVANAIKSALLQDYPNFEVVISDNRSTDDTDSVIETYRNDKRVKYYKNDKNIGMIPNFLLATQRASGDYVTYISSDDYLTNNTFLSEAIQCFKKFKDIVLVHGINLIRNDASTDTKKEYSAVYYKNKYYSQKWIPGLQVINDFPRCHSISFGGTLFAKHQLLACEPFKTPIISADTQVILKLLLLGNVSFICKDTYVARKHSGSVTYSLTDAQVYIENLAYIDVPYEAFLRDPRISRKSADNWKSSMYLYACRQVMEKLYIESKVEFSDFCSYLAEHHPKILLKILGSAKWHWFKTKLRYRLIFKTSMYIRRSASIFKSWF